MRRLANQALHVARGAAIVLRTGAAGIVILIKTRHGDDADLDFTAIAHDGAHRLVRRLRIQRDAVAGEVHHLLRRSRRGSRRQQLQPHQRATRTADLLHDIVQAPADHVGQFAALALADGGDAVVGGELAADGCRTTGDHVDHRHVVIGELQRRADALVTQTHLDVVFLGIARREIIRVRIQRQHETHS